MSMNLPPSPTNARRWVPVRLRIGETDISRMDYWWNEAPMSDPSSANAIVFALERIVRPGTRLRVETFADGRSAETEVNGEKMPLPTPLADWWSRARRGHRVDPITATIALPAEAVLRA